MSTKLLFTSLLVSGTALLAAGCGLEAGRADFAVTAPIVRQAVPSVPSATTYTNPVIDRNFPDPSLLKVGSVYYAYATNDVQNVLCETSPDLVHWTALPDAMPQLPAWAKPDRTWAPEVLAVVPGKRYAAYFAAWDTATNREAVGVAVSTSPAGPFTASPDAQPLVNESEMGGAIDPTTFTDMGGSHYLIWKNDGNSIGQDTWLWVQKLSPDGLRVTGAPAKLIKEDQPWEGSLVEAPALFQHGSRYYLFYSANAYNTCHYSVGYAVADAVTGPYTKPRSTPWLAGTPDVCGPGGEDIVTARDGSTWMAYHTWAKGPNSYRTMSLDKLTWQGDVPVLNGPTHAPMPVP